MAHRIISRPAAKAKGLRFYFTGKQCPKGHVAPRYVCAYSCQECVRYRNLPLRLKRKAWARSKRYAKLNKERLDECRRRRYLKRRKYFLKYYKRWYRNNIDWVRQYRSLPHNRRRINEGVRRCRWKDREKFLAKLRTRKERAKAAARQRRRLALHPEKRAQYRYARLAVGRHTAKQTLSILIKQRYRCANPYCRKDLRKTKRDLDHKRPLSRGGSNWPKNLQWMCMSCNRRKRTRTMAEWLTYQKRYACG